jgi:glucose-6-phosphate isomerase
MKSNLEVENYPRIKDELLHKYLNIINENKIHWDDPFFVDTQSYLNFDIMAQALKKMSMDNLKNIIVLGTGGSIQTLLALKHLAKKQIFTIINSRSVELARCLEETNASNSLVIPVSRGGETLDVNSTIGLFNEKGYKFIGLSSQGTMHDILKKIGCPILDVPDLSGRFAGSISNVAIFPAYIAGIKVKEFLKGLEEGYKEYMNFQINDASQLACYLYHFYGNGIKVVFSMPYSSNLEGTVGLFVQELSESTGKDDKGLMGAYQPAPLCQHSVLEYLLGGTKGAVLPVLWIVEKESIDLTLPSQIEYINGKDAQKVINYQAHATFQALLEQKVPSILLTLQSIDERNIGRVIALIQSTIYYLCLLLNVNWANNPKVIIGKKICNTALRENQTFEELKSIRKKIASNKFTDY